jgi:uncharacterized protein
MPSHPTLSPEQTATIVTQVEQWLDRVVIGLNLCPFAAEPRRQQQIRFQVSPSTNPSDLLADLQSELRHLSQRPATELETTILIIPHSHNDFLDLADRLLQQFGWEGDFQIASFHPQYQFADTQPDDAENLTNRSPYPLLHILREDSVETALDGYPNPELIPDRNIEQMRSLSAEQKRELFPDFA